MLSAQRRRSQPAFIIISDHDNEASKCAMQCSTQRWQRGTVLVNPCTSTHDPHSIFGNIVLVGAGI